MQVEIKQLPSYNFAFVRGIGPYKDSYKIWDILFPWAEKNGLLTGPFDCIGISHDNPAETPAEQCRYDAGIILPEGKIVNLEGSVQLAKTQAGLFACFTAKPVSAEEYTATFAEIFGWLTQNSYEVCNAPYEYYPDSHEHLEDHNFNVLFCVPVQKK